MSNFTTAQLPVDLMKVTLEEGPAGRVVIVVTNASGDSQQIAALSEGKLQLFRLSKIVSKSLGLEITTNARVCIADAVDYEDHN